MSFNDDVRLDTSQVTSGGGGRGGMAIGGGVGGLIIVVVGLFFGVDLSGVAGGGNPGAGAAPQDAGVIAQKCRTGADANRDVECRVVGTANSVQDYWVETLPTYGLEYSPSATDIYRGQTQSACGPASNAVGPFYCPADRKIYIDASFFDDLSSRFGADDGTLAQMYVVAHEYGHHVQNLLGLLDEAQKDPQGAESGAVRVELMADCLAGMWAKGATSTEDAQGRTYLKPLTQQDIQSALSAASAVGDDRIQAKARGQVNPESWTHGSSAQRQRWFLVGYENGDLNACNTFAARTL
jgi:predicted metalloprotease